MTRRFVCSICVILMVSASVSVHADSFEAQLEAWRNNPWLPMNEGRIWHYEYETYDTSGELVTHTPVTTLINEDPKYYFSMYLQHRDNRSNRIPALNLNIRQNEKLPECIPINGKPFNFAAEPGDVEYMSARDMKSGDLTSHESRTVTYLGLEKVIVPSGIFDDCRKYRFEHTSYSSNMDNSETLERTVETFWFARGTGIVKREMTEMYADGRETRTALLLTKMENDRHR